MSLTNLHSFHKRLRLQNATAFSSAHYLAVDNGTCVNPRVVQLSRIQSARRIILAQEPMLYAPTPVSLDKTHNNPECEASSIDFDMIADESLSAPSSPRTHATAPLTEAAEAQPTALTDPESVPETEPSPSKHLKMMDNQADNAKIPALPVPPAIDRSVARFRSIPEVPVRRGAPQRKASRMTWQPGRGTIEKVDKLTGEIVHLVELP